MWRFATCEFDELKLQLRVRGEPVDLELKPVEVLLHLLRHANEVVTKEELLNAVWPGLAVVDGSLATAVSKLRKALGDDDSAIILTVPRVGYRLAAPVEVSPAKKDKQTTADPAPTEPILETSQPEGSKTGWSKPRWSWPVTAAVAVALLAALNPIAVLPAGLFFGFLEAGALAMQREVGVQSSLVYVIQGLTMVFVLCALAINSKQRRV